MLRFLTGFLFAIIFMLALPVADVKAETKQLSGVLELYTSQGCSSCPPADKLMQEYAKRKDLVTLSFSVDYWDYLGWKDTFGASAHSERQRDYARFRGDGQIYTPQMMINGKVHKIGSYKKRIDKAIDQDRTDFSARQIRIKMQEDEKHLLANIQAGKNSEGSATLWLALVKNEARVRIKRGENTGRYITYHKIVRKLIKAGAWQGAEKTIKIFRKDFGKENFDQYVLLLQEGKGGPLVGAAELKRKTSHSQ